MTTVDEYICSARSAMAEGQFEEALRSISAALLFDASNEDALKLATKLGELEERTRLDTIERSTELNGSKAARSTSSQNDHLIKAQRCFLERQFDTAMAEVSLALLANPLDTESHNLEKQIQDAIESKKKEENATLSPIINSILLVAKRYIERDKLDDALEEVNTGLLINNKHPELLWLRNSIVERREIKKTHELQALRNDIVLRIRERFARTEFDQALSEVQLALGEFPNDSEITAIKAEIESAMKRWKDLERFENHTVDVNQHIKNARQLLRYDSVDEATCEIALGFVLAPYNQELKKLEKELWEAQARLDESRMREEAERTKAQQSVKLKLYLLAAEEFTKHGEFSRALDEIVQAYLIDPMDVETKRLEARVRQLKQRTVASPLKLVYKNQQAQG